MNGVSHVVRAAKTWMCQMCQCSNHYSAFRPYGTVLRIAMAAEDTRLDAFIEFAEMDDARAARDALHSGFFSL